jgi:hypothetical protein
MCLKGEGLKNISLEINADSETSIALTIAYQILIHGNTNGISRRYSAPSQVPKSFTRYFCCNWVQCAPGSYGWAYDRAKSSTILEELKLAYGKTSFQEFIAALEIDLGQSLKGISQIAVPKSARIWGDDNHAIPLTIAYQLLIHCDASGLSSYYSSPSQIPKIFIRYFSCSWLQYTTGKYGWMYDRAKGLKLLEMLKLTYQNTSFQEFVEALESDLGQPLESVNKAKIPRRSSEPKILNARDYSNKNKNIEIINPRELKEIGFGTEPIFKPKRIRASEVTIDDRTRPTGDKRNSGILYAPGWSLKNPDSKT